MHQRGNRVQKEASLKSNKKSQNNNACTANLENCLAERFST